ncbi:MAG: 5-formyltetrahydrofolate cyclo-ligase [Zoogloeaceae bacterium]|nr:5-formyltetrahydrofolate cyclo-ligase [Zoogloeaceae bacterium]
MKRPRSIREEMRKNAIQARERLSAGEVEAFSARIVAHLLHHFPQAPGASIAFCWPVRNEPDIRAAIHAWREAGASAALPVVLAPGKPLVFRRWTPQTALLPDRHGIPCPADTPEVVPDVLIIPLNAFDAAGYRLGYGGGFFDRTLAVLEPRPLVIGAGFELGRVADIHPEAHDQPLDWLFTEKGGSRVGRGLVL